MSDFTSAKALLAATLLLGATSASAFTWPSFFFSGTNGSGQASGGIYNYWDKEYCDFFGGEPCPDPNATVDGAYLGAFGGSGFGVGNLNDGVVASGLWYEVENSDGTGPYVGWVNATTPVPEVRIALLVPLTAILIHYESLRIHVDNSGAGGVFAPSDIWFNGIALPFTAPELGTSGWIDIDLTQVLEPYYLLTESQWWSPTLTFGYSNQWVFVSEIELGYYLTVPEPASWGMMIAGFGVIGVALRRRGNAGPLQARASPATI